MSKNVTKAKAKEMKARKRAVRREKKRLEQKASARVLPFAQRALAPTTSPGTQGERPSKKKGIIRRFARAAFVLLTAGSLLFSNFSLTKSASAAYAQSTTPTATETEKAASTPINRGEAATQIFYGNTGFTLSEILAIPYKLKTALLKAGSDLEFYTAARKLTDYLAEHAPSRISCVATPVLRLAAHQGYAKPNAKPSPLRTQIKGIMDNLARYYVATNKDGSHPEQDVNLATLTRAYKGWEQGKIGILRILGGLNAQEVEQFAQQERQARHAAKATKASGKIAKLRASFKQAAKRTLNKKDKKMEKAAQGKGAPEAVVQQPSAKPVAPGFSPVFPTSGTVLEI